MSCVELDRLDDAGARPNPASRLGKRVDSCADVVVETPRNSQNLDEVDGDGRVWFDRHLPGSFAYRRVRLLPRRCGLTANRWTRGNPPGPESASDWVVGVFWIMTGHGREAKVVCVSVGDPAFDEVDGLDHLAAFRLREIAHYFDVYRGRSGGPDR